MKLFPQGALAGAIAVGLISVMVGYSTAAYSQAAKQIPMNIAPAQATLFIINPLTGRKAQFGNLFRTHPPTEDRIARLRSGDWKQ